MRLGVVRVVCGGHFVLFILIFFKKRTVCSPDCKILPMHNRVLMDRMDRNQQIRMALEGRLPPQRAPKTWVHACMRRPDRFCMGALARGVDILEIRCAYMRPARAVCM